MALMHVNFWSEVLHISCSMNVIIPEKRQGVGIEGFKNADGKFKTLWLLHGGGDDHTIWQRRTSIERYVAPLGLAVVMPSVQLSFYNNMAYGGKYFDFMSEELPQIVRGFFPLSEKREDNFIAGLSMGGYGSLKIGLSKPENYSVIGCLSAGNFILNKNLKLQRDLELVFGTAELSTLTNTEHDIFHLANKAIAEGKPLPRIFHACGTEDFGIESARNTAEYLKNLPNDPFRYDYREGPGAHTWEFWDEWIQVFLKELPL